MSTSNKQQQIVGTVKLVLTPGKATMTPGIGSALGPRGVKAIELIKSFNEATAKMDDIPVTVIVNIYKDKTFSFIVKIPSVSNLIKKKLGIQSGAKEPGLNNIATISKADLMDIAKQKMPDMNAFDLDAAYKMVAGTAMSMGLNINEA